MYNLHVFVFNLYFALVNFAITLGFNTVDT